MTANIDELIQAHRGIKREVYLDIENSSPLARDVVEAITPYFYKKAYGNPTITHKPGWMAFERIMSASEHFARSIGASEVEEINFTPGETEANNLAILGTALANRRNGRKIVISEVEPLSIVFSADMLKKYGFNVVKIPVDSEGFVNLDELTKAVDSKTVLVSIMYVNNEIGTIEPIKEAVQIVKEKNAETLFHTDASDAYCKVPMSVNDSAIDLMTLSSYKILGPRGVGVLYVREGVTVEKIIDGPFGTQRLWPGVENTPLIMGFVKASELAMTSFNENILHIKKLRDMLIDNILDEVTETVLNGPIGDKRAPDNVNISFLHCEGEALTIELSLNGIYVSSGSACTRRILQPSHILTAIGRRLEEAHGSILMKVTQYHTTDDIKYVLHIIPQAVNRLRKISPTRE